MRRILSAVLVLVMVFSVIAISGCGKKTVETESPAVTETETPKTDEAKEPVAEETKEETKEEVKEEAPVKETPVQSTPAKAPASKPASKPAAAPVVAPVTPEVTPAPAPAPAPTEEKKPADEKPEVIITPDGYLGRYPTTQEIPTLKMVEDMVEMSDGVRLYTIFLMPKTDGVLPEKMPIIFEKTPYDTDLKGKSESILIHKDFKVANSGYIYVMQDSRGTANSEGVHTPYGERDGLDSYETIEYLRKQPYYNGEIYLKGGSYLATTHYMWLDRDDVDLSDIKGAVFITQTDRMIYRNWKNGANYSLSGLRFMYGNLLKKTHNIENFAEKTKIRPIRDAIKRQQGEDMPELTEFLYHPVEDDFWRSQPGYYAAEHITFPVLFIEGWYDYYVDGMFSMWERLPAETKAKSAFVVGPWEHGTSVVKTWEYQPQNGSYTKYFGIGSMYIDWYDSIRFGKPYPYVEMGKVTYHSVNAHKWAVNEAPWDLDPEIKKFYFNENYTLTEEPATAEVNHTYVYDPNNFEFCFKFTPQEAHPANSVDNVKCFTTPVFEEDTDFYGKTRIKFDVSSDCEDTLFTAFMYFVNPDGKTYHLGAHTGATLTHFYPDYKPGDVVTLDLTFPYQAFTIPKGGAIRVDIASHGTGSSGLSYIAHTNTKGHFAEVTETKVANNTLHLKDAFIEVPVSDGKDIPPATPAN